MKESGTATNFPVGSRATVQESTQEGLTSGFDMGPGSTPPLWPCTTLPSNYELICSVGQRPTIGLGVVEIFLDARGVSAAGLKTSANLGPYTRCLSISSFTSPLRCLVFRTTSSLDAFSSYPLERGYPALPCRTTGKLVAPSPRSSRTKGPFRSGT